MAERRLIGRLCFDSCYNWVWADALKQSSDVMEHTIDACAQKLKMAERAKWKDILKNELEKSPLVSNVFFSMVLVLLEKLVELEFACPCISGWNVVFASLFFIPGILSFVLMMRIQGYKCEKSRWQCCIPLIVWLSLIFLDGQYFACAVTGWSGTYETVPQSVHLKWCKPDNTSNKTSEELLRKTQRWFSISQGIGMVFVGILTVVTGLYPKIQKFFNQNNQDQRPPYIVAKFGR